ncbi:MAG: type II toxin-antitoxin system VapC family toxin [Burkholderiaceae bacterium]
MIVLDASAALELLLNSRLAAQVATRVFETNQSLHAPHLIDVEVAQVLRRLVLRNDIDSCRADNAFRDLADLNITRYPHQMLLPRIWELRSNATVYDAAYLVLAEALDATLLTCDKALENIPGHRGDVEILS